MRTVRYDTVNPRILERIPAEARVLDVGCATGLLGRVLCARGQKRLVGLEADSGMATEARPHYDIVICTDVEHSAPGVLGEERFDVIVCADVLEHLRDPAAVLAWLSGYLAPGGLVLISVPNVAFVSVRLSLLAGCWEYNPQGGIMDRGHLRFFTRRTLRKLIAEAGLRADFVTGYNLVRPRYAFLKILGAVWPTLFSIQFIAGARKS